MYVIYYTSILKKDINFVILVETQRNDQQPLSSENILT